MPSFASLFATTRPIPPDAPVTIALFVSDVFIIKNTLCLSFEKCIVGIRVMREVHLRNVDLNLLHALHALLEERHVTRAAKRCFLSQPAMSRALDRLRETLGDPLLVRTGRAYERTPRGDSLLRELQSLLPRLESMVRGQDFDPQRSQERFRLAVTDHASITLMPPLIRRIRSAAPDIRL